MRSLSVVLTALACGTLSAAAAERPARNIQRPALPFVAKAGFHRFDAVIVKFVEGVAVRIGNDGWEAGAVADLAPYRQLVTGLTVERLFTRAVADLADERAALLRLAPADRPLVADLNNYYRVLTDGKATTEQLVNVLNTMPLVETAYAQPDPASIRMAGTTDISPPTGLFESTQGFKGPAPIGHGYDEMRNIVGARGPDIKVGHLEGSWHFGHEDACQMVQSSVVGSQPTSAWDGWRDHGDAVAGLFTADRNGYGMRGMNDAADLILGTLESDSANMISLCTAASNAGDAWQSSWVWALDSGAHAPVDFFQAEFDAVFVAATKGIVYCFSAGNSGNDLGDFNLYGDRYAPGSADSGGVIVGGGNSGNLDKIGFSCYGSRVDCHAWGEAIGTLGYGDLFGPDSQQRYTGFFGGTSGAGPIAAATAASLSNIVREQNGVQLTAFQIRDLMRTRGTPQAGGGHVGPRVDLKKFLATQSLPDGLMIQGDGNIGQALTVELAGSPSAPAVLFVALGRSHVSVGLNRDFLLDPSFLFPIAVTLNGSGALNLSATLPNSPSLQNVSFFMQLADVKPGGTTHLSNSVELWIRG